MTEERTRRDVLRKAGTTVVVAGGLSSVVDVAAADTASGYVELTTTATVPTNTTLDITIYESTDGDSTADRQQTKSIPDGTTTTQYDLLESSTAQGDILWLELSLSTSDDTTTPELDSAKIALPETTNSSDGGGTSEPVEKDPQTIGQLWNNYRAWVAATVIFFSGVGLWSRSLTLAAWAGYVAFLHIAFTTGTTLFQNIAYATLVLVFLGFAFKLTRLEFEGEA